MNPRDAQAYFFLFGIVVLGITVVWIALTANRKAVLRRNAERGDWGRRNDLKLLDPIDPNLSIFKQPNSDEGKMLLAENSSVDTFRHQNQYARNILQGMYGSHEVTVFDYQYTVSTGKSSTTYHFGVVLAALQKNIPEFEIRATRFWDKVSAFFGKKDIAIGSTEFDDDFHVDCADEPFMKALLDLDTMDLVRQHDRQAWYARGGNRLIAIRYGQLSDPEYDDLLAGAVGMAARVERALDASAL